MADCGTPNSPVDGPSLDQRLLDVHPAIFWTADDEGRLTIASKAMADRLGLAQSGNAPDAQIALIHPDDRQPLATATRRAREDGSLLDWEARMRIADGSYRWMRLRALFDRVARRWHGSAEDVHDRRDAEEALRIANERLAFALEGNNAWAWDLDLATGRFWYSDGWKRVLGYEGEEIAHDLSDFRRLVHPDDQPRLVALHHAHLAGEIAIFEADYRLRARDGAWIWVHDRGRAIERDAEGRARRAIGVRTDISARKAAEAKAQQSSARLRTVLDNITDGVVAIAADGGRAFSNRAYAEFFAEALGESDWAELDQLFAVFDVLDEDGRLLPTSARPILRVLAGETIRDLPVRARLRNTGRLYHFIYNGQPIRGADGKVELAVLSVRDVTERHATQRALEESEARFRGVFESGVVGMSIFDACSGKTLAINDRLLEMTGSTRQLFDEGKWNWRQATPAEFSFRDDAAIAQILAEGSFEPYDKAFNRSDGTRIEVRLSSAPMPGGNGQVAACIEDITEPKRAQDQLRDSEHRLQAIIESLDEGVIAIGPDQRVLFANDAFHRMMWDGALPTRSVETLDEIMSAFDIIDSDGDLIPPERRPMPMLLAGEHLNPTESIVRFADGRYIHVIYRGQPILDAQGGVRLAILIIRDVTREVQADQKLKALQQELVAVSRVSAMGTMAGSLAHELNQPLAAVANYATAAQLMVNAGAAPGSIQNVLTRVTDESVRAGQIVSRLRRFITKGEIERQPESLATIVKEAVAIANGSASARSTQVKLKLDPAADIVVVDRIQLQQVVFNLVRNAVEAMANSNQRELMINSRAVDDKVELTLADRGPGLAPEVKRRLFEPFITTKETGMGIGLPICRSIVRAHGGDIRAEPRPRGGTLFIVTLPRGDANA